MGILEQLQQAVGSGRSGQNIYRLPGDMLCHEGLLKLRQMDEKNHIEYVPTLKTYLEQHLSATQAAKHMFIHRSTFLYRIERIREILQIGAYRPGGTVLPGAVPSAPGTGG